MILIMVNDELGMTSEEAAVSFCSDYLNIESEVVRKPHENLSCEIRAPVK
jgi:hypothetical protein